MTRSASCCWRSTRSLWKPGVHPHDKSTAARRTQRFGTPCPDRKIALDYRRSGSAAYIFSRISNASFMCLAAMVPAVCASPFSMAAVSAS